MSLSSRWLPALAGLAIPVVLAAQNPAPAPATAPAATGRIVGRVLEEGTGSPIAGAQVSVAGAAITGSSAVDGRYTLLRVPAGTVSLSVRAIGYQAKTVAGVEVAAGAVVSQDVALAASTVQLGEIVVAAAAERGSVARALEEQRSAPNIVNAVTAEQISKSPDADAAQAVQRVSGVTVQDGRYVFVRGLGERYTTTSLNNARLPSPEPERKVVPLDLFPSNLLEAVTTSKTFTPDQPGDFSGAQVNLQTREFDMGRVFTWSLMAGYNTAATGRTLQRAPTTGSEWRGMPGAARAMPQDIRDAGDLTGTPGNAIPGLIGSFRDVWSAQSTTGAPNASSNFSIGGEDPVFGHLVGYVASLSYNFGTEVHRGEERALGVADGSGGAQPQNQYRGETVTGSVLWGGILNLTTRFGSGSKLTFSNTYNRSGDNTAVRAAGSNEEFARNFDITRLQYVSRSVRSNQLAGEHRLTGAQSFTWALTSSAVTRDEPDRSDLVYEANIDTVAGRVTPIQWFGAPRSGNRTFSTLSERAGQADLAWRLQLGTRGAFKVGGQVRSTDRDADSRSYDIVNLSQSSADLARPPEIVLQDTARLFLTANANGGRYTASDRLGAGFAQFELPLSGRLRLVGGARVEHSQVTVDSRTTQGTTSTADNTTTDVLPALALNIELAHDQQLRLSASQTLSRPEYREMAEVCYFEILGGVTVCGNHNLHRALIKNADARWEWYPHASEVVSVGLFAKHFTDPIERILVGTTGATTASFINTAGADNYGIELELRKNLGFLGAALLPFSVSFNGTLMHSRIDLGAGNVSSLTNTQRAMVGQAPYVVNAGLAYVSRGGRFNATALYNVVGRRVVEAGVQPLPDTYEEARSVLDASLRYGLSRALALKLDARNLLDAPFHTTQGAVTRLRYTVGRSISAGFSWEP